MNDKIQFYQVCFSGKKTFVFKRNNILVL